MALLVLVLAVASCDDSGPGGLSMDLSATATPTCMAYCQTIMANCVGDGTGGTMANQQYTTMTNCLNSCKAFPVGTAADTSGNTLGCRANHANLAKSDPVTHCPHAGPGGAGVCGNDCDGYCAIAMMYCTAANGAQVYGSLAECMSVCNATPDDVKFNISVQGGPHVACLLYHVQEASTVPPDHCNGDLQRIDAGSKSTTCM